MKSILSNTRASIVESTTKFKETTIPATAADTSTVMVDGDEILTNPGTGTEAFGVWRNFTYGWNPIISSGITLNDSDIVPPSTFHNNIKDAVIPYFNADHECVGVLKITSNSGTNPMTYTKLWGTNPVAGNFLLSPQYDFTVCRCKYTWNDIEAVEGTFDWDNVEKINGVKIVRELNRIIDIAESGYVAKKKQICPVLVLDDSQSNGSAARAHAGTCPAQTGMTTVQVKLVTGASTTNDDYNGHTIYIVAGTGAGQIRTISDYAGDTLIATISTAWTTQPDNTSVYYLTETKALPDWLVEDITTGGIIDGKAYNKASDLAGFSPNYANTTLITKHALLMAAMGTKYANDPLVQRVLFGSLGHWGELHITLAAANGVGGNQDGATVLAIAVTDQYFDHYKDAFGADNIEPRRSIGSSGVDGCGFYCHGFGNDGQVFSDKMGSIDANIYGLVDNYGIDQAAVEDFLTRHKSIEPFGGANENKYLFLDEPSSIVDTDDVENEWESGLYATADGNKQAHDNYYRTVNQYTTGIVGGATYTIKIRSGSYANGAYGYQCRVHEWKADGTYIKTTTGISNNGAVTLDANTGKVAFSIHSDNPTMYAMTDATALDANLRMYAGVVASSPEVVRNIEWTMKQLEDYKPLLYCDDLSTATVGSGAPATNVATFLKKIGYRLGTTAKHKSKVNANTWLPVELILHNIGCANAWLPEYKMEISLLAATGHAVAWSSVMDCPELPVGNTSLQLFIPTDIATGNYHIAIAIYHPDLTEDLYVSLYGGTAEGHRTIISDIEVV